MINPIGADAALCGRARAARLSLRGFCAGLFGAILLLAGPTIAGALRLDGTCEQGGLVRGATVPGAKVTLDGRPVRVAPDGRFIIGFGRDAPAHAELVVELPGGVVERHELAIEPRSYEIQRIDGLPSQMVTPDAATLARIRREAEALRAARGADSSEPSFEQRMVWPVTGPISGVYGSQRILDGKPRAPHSGVDIAAPAGAAVGAAAAGIVTFAKDLFLSGGTVVIDHGYGLSTTYAHLATVDVAVGDRVHRGQRIGTVGSGGRATGPHLHWGAGWYQVRLDPALLAGPMPKASAAR